MATYTPRDIQVAIELEQEMLWRNLAGRCTALAPYQEEFYTQRISILRDLLAQAQADESLPLFSAHQTSLPFPVARCINLSNQ